MRPFPDRYVEYWNRYFDALQLLLGRCWRCLLGVRGSADDREAAKRECQAFTIGFTLNDMEFPRGI